MKDSNGIVRRGPMPEKNFMVAKNEWFDLPGISWEANAILLYILSKPADWIVYQSELERKDKGAGRHKIRRIINELMEAGYMKRETVRNEDGSFKGTRTLVTSEPGNFADLGFPAFGSPDNGPSVLGEPATTKN